MGGQDSEGGTVESHFWRRVAEGVSIALIVLIAEALFRKIGGIDVFGLLYCWIGVQVFGCDPLNLHC